MDQLVAIDAGTTGVRSLVVDGTGHVNAIAYRELTQHFPRPGWVEHDPSEIMDLVTSTLDSASRDADGPVAAIGITNQRESVICWDRSTGEPLGPAIVWQDRRTAGRCLALQDAGALPLVRHKTGLVLDPYFSATKMAWLLEEGSVEISPSLALGTVDSWVIWNLTGGRHGGTFATDPSNASRTLCYDIRARAWSPELCELFHVPMQALPEVRPSCSRFATVACPGLPARLQGIPISGVLGDQQAALFGQACLFPGMAKTTYGTGSFVLVNAGGTCPDSVDGLLATVAWDLGSHQVTAGSGDDPEVPTFAYALEGSAFSTGATIQWLRDALSVGPDSASIGDLASSVPDSGGVVIVPAFTGLGSPWWDAEARGMITGLTRGPTRAHLARAAVQAIAQQNHDILEAMANAAIEVRELRVDGGAAVLDSLCQYQADLSGIPTLRPVSAESTGRGAALLAGLAEGVWEAAADLVRTWEAGTRFDPDPASHDRCAEDRQAWLRAVSRSLGWAAPSPPA